MTRSTGVLANPEPSPWASRGSAEPRSADGLRRASSVQRSRLDGAHDLPIRVRRADGTIFDGTLDAARHRAIHLGLLHGDSEGYVEIAAGRRPPGGKLRITTRKDPEHFLRAGIGRAGELLGTLKELAAAHVAAGDEVFVAPAVRHERAAAKAHVTHTNWLWIDVDGRDGLPVVKRLLRRKPAHLVVQSAGSGGVHCYWRLRAPLMAHTEPPRPDDGADWPGWLTGGASGETIELAHERLIYALGWEWREGRPVPTVADRACKDRSRVMRLAGTVNGKTGDHARIIWADLALPGWPLRALIGDLPDPPRPKRSRRRAGAPVNHDDPYKRIAPVEYFQRLAGIEVPRSGLVSCPNPSHEDRTPSCHVGSDAGEGWCCHGCGAAGAIYDLASVLDGGPTGPWLRGEEFLRARERVRRAFSDV
jgi:hypothetical protein